MRWQRGASSPDVIDARGGGGGGFPGGAGRVGGGLGLVGVIVVVLVQVLGGGGGGGGFSVDQPFGAQIGAPATGRGIPAAQDPDRDLKDFSAYVFTRTQSTWSDILGRAGKPYERAKLVLFSGGVQTGCGAASSATGPFYCPADQRVYLDLSFYAEMQSKLGGGGDFAWAYVIAHEMGHHVQQQLGTSDDVRRAQQQDPGQGNALSVRLELQADCYAGVWAHTVYVAGDLEAGDVQEALDTAAAIGDDRLQQQAGRRVSRESFTHGTSEQRTRWFRRGQDSGEPASCDTFAADPL